VKLAASAALGIAFGFAISWVQATDPDAIRQMLLLDDLYLFGVLGVSTATAFLGMRVLRRFGVRALVTREPIHWTAVRPEWRHVFGSAVFGLGWGVANTCPGPVAAQLGQGALWSLLTIAGIVIGIRVRERQLAVTASRTPAQPAAPPV
jgi:uncharacterized membrane protein YedE/YeeE